MAQFGYNIVSVSVVNQSPVSDNVFTFDGPAVGTIQQQFPSGWQYNIAALAPQVAKPFQVTPTSPGPSLYPTISIAPYTSRSQYNTPAPKIAFRATPILDNVNNDANALRARYSELSLFTRASSDPIALKTTTARRRVQVSGTTQVTTASSDQVTSYFLSTITSGIIPYKTLSLSTLPDPLTFSDAPAYGAPQAVSQIFTVEFSTYTTSNNTTYYPTSLYSSTGSAPSNLLFSSNITSSIDVNITTTNTVSQASYSFVPTYTTFTTVNVAPSSYSSVTSTNQQSLDSSIISKMSTASGTVTIQPSTATAASSYLAPRVQTAKLTLPLYVAGTIDRFSYNSFAPQSAIWKQTDEVTATSRPYRKIISILSTTDTYFENDLDAMNGTVSEITEMIDTSLVPYTNTNITGINNLPYWTVNSVQPVMQYDMDLSWNYAPAINTAPAAIEFNSVLSVSGPLTDNTKYYGVVDNPNIAYFPARTATSRIHSSVSWAKITSFPTATNYISVNNAGINIVPVLVYESTYGGLRPSGTGGDVGTGGGGGGGVLGYQYWS